MLFEGKEWLFRGYNITSNLFTVFFSEPRAGVYYAFDALLNGTRIQPWQVVNWITSLLSTLLVGLWITGWRERNVEERRIIALGRHRDSEQLPDGVHVHARPPSGRRGCVLRTPCRLGDRFGLAATMDHAQQHQT